MTRGHEVDVVFWSGLGIGLVIGMVIGFLTGIVGFQLMMAGFSGQ